MVSRALGNISEGVGEGFERARRAWEVTVSSDSQKNTGNNASTWGGKTQKTLTEQLKKMVGIDVGIGALLKQSQIFTGFLGNLFAIVGALIDTVLAPLAPIAFKALAKLGALIPSFAKVAQTWIPKITDWLGKTFNMIDGFFKSIKIDNLGGKILKALGVMIAINLGIRTVLTTGKAMGTIMGLRQGGALNMAYRGGRSILGGGLGGIGRGLMAPIAATAAFGSAFLGGGGGGTPVAGGGSVSQANMYYDKNVDRWRYKAGTPGGVGGRFVAPGEAPSGRGIMGKLGKVGRIPFLGSALAGLGGYAGGRDQGMSVGMSAGRGATAMGATLAGAKGGAWAGAAIGTMIAPGIGTAIGGALGGLAGGIAGYMGGTGLFDMLFGKKGGGTTNLDLAGQIGASGYQAPLFIAEAQEYWSKQVRRDGMVLDDHIIALEASKLAMQQEQDAREEATAHIEDWGAFLDKHHPGWDQAPELTDDEKILAEQEAESKALDKAAREALRIRDAFEAWKQTQINSGLIWDDSLTNPYTAAHGFTGGFRDPDKEDIEKFEDELKDPNVQLRMAIIEQEKIDELRRIQDEQREAQRRAELAEWQANQLAFELKQAENDPAAVNDLLMAQQAEAAAAAYEASKAPEKYGNIGGGGEEFSTTVTSPIGDSGYELVGGEVTKIAPIVVVEPDWTPPSDAIRAKLFMSNTYEEEQVWG